MTFFPHRGGASSQSLFGWAFLFPSRVPAVLAVALLLLAGCVPLSAAESVRADRSETWRDTSGVRKVYAGAVSFRAAGQGLVIQADSARVWVPPGSTGAWSNAVFFRNVSLQDSARRIQADTLEYDPRGRVATFRGRVELTGKGRELHADRVVYRLQEKEILARGNVWMRYPAEGVWMQAAFLRYDAAADSGLGTGETDVRRTAETGGDTLDVRADSLRFGQRGTRMDFCGRVRIQQAGIRAQARNAAYRKAEEQMDLQGDPRATWTEGAETHRDSVALRAVRMAFGLRGGAVHEIGLTQDAEVRSQSRRDSTVETRTVGADSVEMFLDGAHLHTLQARGSVRAQMEADSSHTELRGPKLKMSFEGGEVDSLVLEGGGKATYKGPDSVNRLSGNRMVFHFLAGHLQFVRARGEARCRHTGPAGEEDRVELSGDRLLLVFESGRLERATADGGVQGTYAPPKEKKP